MAFLLHEKIESKRTWRRVTGGYEAQDLSAGTEVPGAQAVDVAADAILGQSYRL
jgi:hypothetical protein